MTVSAEVMKDLAPTGQLRATINLGNIVLAQGTPEAPGGVTQARQRSIATSPGVRLIDERCREIRQAMGAAKGKTAGAAYLRAFIEEMKKSGFVADALKRSGQGEATVAP